MTGWSVCKSSRTSHKDQLPSAAAHSVFYLPETTVIPLEAVVHGSPLPFFAVTLVVAEVKWVINNLKCCYKNQFSKAPVDLQWFFHFCRKNYAFVEAPRQRDSGLPQELSCSPRDPLSAAGHLYVLQTARRYVLPAGPSRQGAARPCLLLSPANRHCLMPEVTVPGNLLWGLALLTSANRAISRVAVTFPVFK